MPNSGVFLVGIRRLRLARKWTQRELGEKIGKTGNCIYRYERRPCSPRADLLKVLSKAFGCDIWELFFDPKVSRRRTA
jgi:transcriptional regulator with XRE-family HTH domain